MDKKRAVYKNLNTTDRNRLAIHLREKKSQIIQKWDRSVREQGGLALGASKTILSETLPFFLDQVIVVLSSEEKDVSKRMIMGTVRGSHGAGLQSYTLEQILLEYRILRQILNRFLWESGPYSESEHSLISDCVDLAMTQTVSGFQTKSFRSPDGIAGVQERFRLLVDAVKDYGIFMMDPMGNITSWNEGAKRVNGYDAHEILGKHVSVFYIPEDKLKRKAEEELEVAKVSGRYEVEGWRVRKDGGKFWANVVVTPIWNQFGDLLGYAKVTRDLTQQNEAQEQIQRLNEQLSKQLSERTAELQRIFEADLLGIAFFEMNGKIYDANDAFLKLIGYSREELTSGKINWGSLTPQEWMEPTLNCVRQMEKNGVCKAYEKEYRKKDHSRVPILIGGARLASHPDKGVAFVIDLTERKRAEVESRKSEEKYRLLSDVVPQPIWVTNPDGSYYHFNARWFEYTGIDKSELEVHPQLWLSLVHADDREMVMSIWERGQQTGEIQGELRFRRKDGIYHWFLYQARPLRDENGKIIKWFGSSIDIDEQKRLLEYKNFIADASRTLASSLDYKTTLRAVTNLCVPKFADWCIVYIIENTILNRVAVVHKDLSKTALAQKFENLPTDLAALGGVALALRTGKSVLYSSNGETSKEECENFHQLSTKDPQQLQLIRELGLCSYVSVVMYARGQQIGGITFVSTQPDFPYQKEEVALFEQLAQVAALAVDNSKLFSGSQEAVRAREDVLAIVSHDLRNPLGSITLSANMLHRLIEKMEIYKPIESQVERIERAANRMDQLIQDILDVTKLEAGTFALELNLESVGDMIRDAVEVFEPIVREKGVILQASTFPGCCLVQCDFRRVNQVISNLIGNAIKFTPSGGEIVLGSKESAREMLIWVSDTGPGIRIEDQEKIFNRYWQATETNRKGVGLGLAISKGIVEAHGGRIWVESTLGIGSTFYFTLPKT